MLSDNLLALRKWNKMTQEETAEKVGVSRQALAKWESGETIPDVEKCRLLAELYGVSLDDLVNYSGPKTGIPVPPKGRHIFGAVTVDEQGRITLPFKARKIFGIKSGDHLVVLGDETQGLALIKEKSLLDMMDEIKRASSHTQRS